MRTLRTAWESEHGRGSVVGLAPSAVAAQVLADDLGIRTENTAIVPHAHDEGFRQESLQVRDRVGPPVESYARDDPDDAERRGEGRDPVDLGEEVVFDRLRLHEDRPLRFGQAQAGMLELEVGEPKGHRPFEPGVRQNLRIPEVQM
nr:AAA family ATPase [Microbacterium sp. BF1]